MLVSESIYKIGHMAEDLGIWLKVGSVKRCWGFLVSPICDVINVCPWSSLLRARDGWKRTVCDINISVIDSYLNDNKNKKNL